MAWKDLTLSDKARMMKLAVNSGITDLKTIEEVYNKFEEGGHLYGGKKEKTQRIKHAIQVFDPVKVAERVPGDDAITGGTKYPWNAVHHYLHNDDNYVRNRIAQYEQDIEDGLIDPEDNLLETLKVHEDAKRVYLGLPQLYNSLEPSAYRPTIGTSENPYQVNALLSDREFEDTILPLWGTWKSGDSWDAYHTAGRVENLGKTAQLRDIPHLQAAGLSEGFDKKGQYISLYDVWDYNTKIKNANGDNIGKYVGGTPVDIYQRYYLDDWLDIPEEARGNPYIAPSYIEAEYQPNPEHLSEDYANSDFINDTFAKGGKIYIKPENRGKFTALKKRTGHSASWFKAHGTPAQRKMAVFALNSKHWGRKKANGGSIFFNTRNLII